MSLKHLTDANKMDNIFLLQRNTEFLKSSNTNFGISDTQFDLGYIMKN